ncbi:uncharacterized protein LOC112571753 isoform X1 [Pomacea canaliculata]|uniref:uncharacterized protein LOC112571753 isoform X1 n=2 Tax=Pomacea canaliculata TaxID=400727 RepID=UPI000D73C080|nr:uncharacterized protein LOC112571753 isoform X1 [Pomacea canaliculata]XP_025106800.1 uncharacterized protein LOC112571753 isoform X1 [Pomacea canaliculata]XP_025106801.1 uncharacterized protein LOC112571753 isoform X1 [Pomacea canaliculata]
MLPDDASWAANTAAEMPTQMPLVVPPMVLQSPPAGEGKRRHLKSRRMIEYEKEKDRAAPQKQRMCPHPGCKKLFSSAPGLRYHVKTHSPDAANFRCDRCRREFKSNNGLKYHIQRRKCPEGVAAITVIPDQPVIPIGQIPTLERREESPVSNVHISEEKYEENIRTKSLPLLLDEPQHRKVETRWERTKATAEAKNRPPSLQQQTDLGYQDQRLMQFANIATGPQSPLLQPKPIDWDQQRVPTGEKVATPTPSDPQVYMNRHAPTPPSPSSTAPSPHMTSLSPRSDLSPLDTSAIYALSTMAQQCRSSICHDAYLQKKSQEVSSGKQMAPKGQHLQGDAKGKRPMNSFMMWSQIKRPELSQKYPKTDNREISTMLSKEWNQLDPGKKKEFQEKAKVRAAQQKQQHPDCWKRKK